MQAMKFSPKGPDIPDQLLNARDQGRVVFFCGAGISTAKAKLPTFKDLTRQVVKRLRPIAEEEIINKIDMGCLPYELVYELLEDEFEKYDIEREVAHLLKPKRGEKLTLHAHEILLKLSLQEVGGLRLVTTNHDRLFEEAANELNIKIK